ncbi:MAG: PhoP regulatory network YrbL family protein, partial [Gammaproteobacteria bacterium]|nr:PhoP regulatory network YrbL family protein [Gammaproteobacteria bacterium]
MSQSIINLNSEPVGQGRERICYEHPQDTSKLIKISNTGINTQPKREINFYRKLEKKGGIEYTHIPRFYGHAKQPQ